MYGYKAWTLGKEEKRKLEAFELWRYRNKLKIRWMGRITNEQVLNRKGEKRSL